MTMDADGQHTVEDVHALYSEWLASRADMHVAKRQIRDGGMRSQLSAVLNLTASILAGEHIPDFGSGLRLFDRRIALALIADLPDGFDFNAVLTMRFIVGGYSVAWSPTPSRKRTSGKSHVRWVDGIKVLSSLMKTTWR